MIDLVEKVARAIVKYDGGDWERDPLDQTRFAVGQAKAVIPIVLEAAARVALNHLGADPGLIVAAAIRALGDNHD